MKKICSSALALGMALSLAPAAFADDASTPPHEMTVTYTAPSSYTVSIPASITVGENAKVAASNVVLHEGETLLVSVSSEQYSDSWQLKNGDNSIPYTIKNGERSIVNGGTVLNAKSSETPSVILATALAEQSEPLSYAGAYTDTLVFSVDVGIDLSSLTRTYVIKDSKTYTFTGSGTHGIEVETNSGNPTIKLIDATINTDCEGIYISDDTVISVHGNNFVTSSSYAGIAGHEVNTTVTITGNSRADQQTVRGGGGRCGIGEFCKTIEIKNVTVSAYGSYEPNRLHSPGIGCPFLGHCETITIDNAAVSAYGAGYSSAIGGGLDASTGSDGASMRITIKNHSTVSVKKEHGPSKYIGKSRLTGTDADETPHHGIDATIEDGSQVIILKE